MSTTASPATKAAAPAAASDSTKSTTKDGLVAAPTTSPRTPKRRREASTAPESVSVSPGSPDSLIQELAGRRVGERSLTPYPPPMFSPRVTNGTRSVTPYPGLRRWSSRDGGRGFDTPSTSRSTSPDKENEPFIRSSAPSPSPKKKGKIDGEARGRTLSRSSSGGSLDSNFTFGVPTNTPRSVSRDSSSSESSSAKSIYEPPTPPMIARALEDRLLEIEVTRRCKDLTELPLADVTEAYTDLFDPFDAAELLCPPNTPVAVDTQSD